MSVSGSGKQAYAAPELTSYGSIAKLTQAGTSLDGGGGGTGGGGTPGGGGGTPGGGAGGPIIDVMVIVMIP